MLGDNRNNSHDSRSWRGGLGAGVPFKNIKGRATFVWISWHSNGGIAWDRLLVDGGITVEAGKLLRSKCMHYLNYPPPQGFLEAVELSECI